MEGKRDLGISTEEQAILNPGGGRSVPSHASLPAETIRPAGFCLKFVVLANADSTIIPYRRRTASNCQRRTVTDQLPAIKPDHAKPPEVVSKPVASNLFFSLGLNLAEDGAILRKLPSLAAVQHFPMAPDTLCIMKKLFTSRVKRHEAFRHTGSDHQTLGLDQGRSYLEDFLPRRPRRHTRMPSLDVGKLTQDLVQWLDQASSTREFHGTNAMSASVIFSPTSRSLPSSALSRTPRARFTSFM